MDQVEQNTSKKRRAIDFEKSIMNFLTKLEFEDVDGAKDSFKINGIQVDVCGGHENTLLIIECKHKDKKKVQGEDSIRNYIKTLRGDIHILEKGFKSHPIYSKYEKFKYIICTKNYNIRKVDFDFANQEPHVHLCNEDFINYYEELYQCIGKYAKYDMLGELWIKPEQDVPILVPAFLVTFGQSKMYNFVIDPKVLLEVAYVARRTSRRERNYQRMINKKRIESIAQYINDDNILPNNIIISINKVKFHPKNSKYNPIEFPALNMSYGILEFPNDYKSCWIIDGQHRLYAFMKTNKEKYFNMPVTAFENLSNEEQCKFFLDINKNQKPVPSDLVWDLNGDMLDTQTDGIISRTVKKLNNSGPLYHMIYYPSLGVKTALLKISGICISIKRSKLAETNTISKTANPLYHKDSDKTETALSNALIDYFDLIKLEFEENWKLEDKGFILTDGGMSVFIYLFEKILQRITLKGKSPTKEEYKKYILPLKKLFESDYSSKEELKKLRGRTSGEGPKHDLLIEFIIFIKNEINDQLFGGDIEIIDENSFSELESNLKELINTVLLKNIGDNWFEDLKSMDKEMYSIALKHHENHGLKDKNKVYKQLTLGNCRSIIEHKTYVDYFKPLFTKNEYFYDWKEFEGSLSQIVRMRNTQKSHDVGVTKKLHDDNILKLNLDKLSKCLKEIDIK